MSVSAGLPRLPPHSSGKRHVCFSSPPPPQPPHSFSDSDFFFFPARKQFLHVLRHLSLAQVFVGRLLCLFWPIKYREKNAFQCIFLNPRSTLPLSPLSLSLPLSAFHLCHLLFSHFLSSIAHPPPPHGFPNCTTTPLTDVLRQIYSRRPSIGRQRDRQDLTLRPHWPRPDRLIYGCAVI